MIEINKNNNKKYTTKQKVILSILLIIIISIIISSLILTLTKDQSNNTTTEHQSHNTKQNNHLEYQVGETFKFDNLEIRINNWETTYYLKGNIEAQDGYKWVVLNATIYNPTNKTISLEEGTFFPTRKYTSTLVYNDVVNYNNKFYLYSDWILAHDNIMPLGTLNGIYSFLVPESVDKSGKLHWEFTFNKVAKQNELVKVILRNE